MTIIVPFSPGGSSDQGARLVASKLSDGIGQPVVVENRIGANGQVAAAQVKSARPDGHTLLWASHGILAINPSLYTRLTYDPLKDFEPVTLVFKSTHLLIVPVESHARNATDLVALARQQPGRLSFASVGIGSGSHLAGEMFKFGNRLDVAHVPYKGSTNALPDLVAGRVHYMFDGPGNAVELIRGGKLRALGVTDARRFAQLPDVPTMAEAGIPDNVINSWFGLVTTAGTPKPVVVRLHAEIAKAIGAPDIAQKIADFGGSASASRSPEEFSTFIASENARLGRLIRATGVQADAGSP
ncbi:MAG: tripartite tricarboxylate transporter substrate binding protein [Xanthobacteraceae bacterium]|nr:tripartite tricarboxylate transporter substrate binding protein [Xanthobacteraceae bacterium]